MHERFDSVWLCRVSPLTWNWIKIKTVLVTREFKVQVFILHTVMGECLYLAKKQKKNKKKKTSVLGFGFGSQVMRSVFTFFENFNFFSNFTVLLLFFYFSYIPSVIYFNNIHCCRVFPSRKPPNRLFFIVHSFCLFYFYFYLFSGKLFSCSFPFFLHFWESAFFWSNKMWFFLNILWWMFDFYSTLTLVFFFFIFGPYFLFTLL